MVKTIKQKSKIYNNSSSGFSLGIIITPIIIILLIILLFYIYFYKAEEFGGKPTPQPIISLNASQSCFISTTEHVYCWGGEIDKEFTGDGGSDINKTPILMTGSDELKNKKFKSLSVGSTSTATCAIDSDGIAYCWSIYGAEAGKIKISIKNETFKKLGLTIESIAASSQFMCAISSVDSVYCWGDNSFGQLGNNSKKDEIMPVAVDMTNVKNKTVKMISLGGDHSCMVTADGLAYCWGDNSVGQLGDGTKNDSLVPVPVNSSMVLKDKVIETLSAGRNFTCAVASDSKPYCWGKILQHDRRVSELTYYPFEISSNSAIQNKKVKMISSGAYHACAIADDNLSYCWGDSDNALGIGDRDFSLSDIYPTAVDTSGVMKSKTIKTMAVSGDSTCAISQDNEIFCWGEIFGTGLGKYLNTNDRSGVPVLMYYYEPKIRL